MLDLKELKAIKGDASFRRFFRNKKNNSIVVHAKKEKLKNLLIYDAINKILIKNKILAPKLLNHNYKDHLIEVEDFGDDTLFKILENKKTNREIIFKKILKTLIKLQSIKDKHVINFKNQKYKLKKYDNKILSDEANLFSEWYAPRKLNSSKMRNFKNKSFFESIRRKPSDVQVYFLLYRLLAIKSDHFVRRKIVGDLVMSKIKNKDSHGVKSLSHNYWLFPIRTKNRKKLVYSLISEGFDATFTSTQLVAIKGTNENHSHAIECKKYIEETVYLPVYYQLPKSKIKKIVSIINQY